MNQLPILLLSLTSLIIVETASVDTIIDRNNLFAVDIFQRLYVNDYENILFSPFATYLGLSLLRSGAKEASADQLRKGLYGSFDLKEDELAFRQLLQDMKHQNITTDVVSGIFVDKIYEIRDEYKQVASYIFNATTSNIDLSDKQEVENTVNKWIEKEGNSKIRDIIVNPYDIKNLDTRVVLLNALQFKARWLNIFYSSDTVEQIFFRPGSDNVKVPTMIKKSFHGSYAENKKLNAKFLELPFTTCLQSEDIDSDDCVESASLVIVLPNEIDGVNALKSNLYEALSPQNFSSTLLNVYLPRFEDENAMDFGEILEMLGVSRIFSSTTADLSGIASKAGDIYLYYFQQAILLKVNERGMEVFGATDLSLDTTTPIDIPENSAGPKKRSVEEAIDFRVNHPFLYYVKVYGLITFVGKIYNL